MRERIFCEHNRWVDLPMMGFLISSVQNNLAFFLQMQFYAVLFLNLVTKCSKFFL